MKRTGLVLLLLGILTLSAPGQSHPTLSGDADKARWLRRQYARFQSLPVWRQEQIRELDVQLNALDEPTQIRLRGIMQEYALWLKHLPEEEQQKIASAKTFQDKLQLIRSIRDQEWIESLPQSQRETYAHTSDPAEKRALMAEWRNEDDARRLEWDYATHNWKTLQQKNIPEPLNSPVIQKQILEFARQFDPHLTPGEREGLKQYSPEADPMLWPYYLKRLHEATERHPIYPGTGPKSFEELKKESREILIGFDKGFAKKNLNGLPKELVLATGKWPEFALALNDYVRRNNLKLPQSPGSSHRDEMPGEIQDFISGMEKKLQETDRGRKRLKELHEAEGKWPEYPKKILELARESRLNVPGCTPPTQKIIDQVWKR